MDCVYEFLCELLNATTPSGRLSHLSRLPATEPKRVTIPKPIPYHDYVSTKSDQTSMDLNSRSPAVNLFQPIRLSVNPFLHNPSFESFPRLDFKPFRRLGFDIWDREKMARLGMGKVPRFIKQPEFRWVGPFSSGSSAFEFYFRWNSLVVENCNDA